MPFLADTDFPWVIVAMIFIAFFRWLTDRIKEAVRGPATEDFEPEEEEETEFEVNPTETVAPPPPPRLPPPVPASHPGGEFRRLLETLRTEPPAPQPPPPVPSPATPPRTVAGPPSASSSVPLSPRAPVPAKPAARAPRRPSLALTPRAIRDGIVLREILGPPVSLREEDSRGA